MLESVFNKVTVPQGCSFIKKRLQQSCFLVEFGKFLRTTILKNTLNDCFCLSYFSFLTFLLITANKVVLNLLIDKGITKPCTHLHPVPSTSTQLISTSTQLHPPPPSSFQPSPSSLLQPQQYLNQNIARNWAISPSLDGKIKNCPF